MESRSEEPLENLGARTLAPDGRSADATPFDISITPGRAKVPRPKRLGAGATPGEVKRQYIASLVSRGKLDAGFVGQPVGLAQGDVADRAGDFVLRKDHAHSPPAR
jgi:hypothetical protein